MNKFRINGLLLSSLFIVSSKADVPDYTNLFKSTRKKTTSVSVAYQDLIVNYRQGAAEYERIKNNKSESVDVRLSTLTVDEALFFGVAGIINSIFESLSKQEQGPVALEEPEELDIEGTFSKKTQEELRLVSPNGKGLIYWLNPATKAGRAVSLRYLIDPHVSKEDIEAKQLFQKMIIENKSFKDGLQGSINTIVKQKVEKKILDAFVLCTRNKDAEQVDVLGLVDQIDECISAIAALHPLVSKDQKFDGKKILFMNHLNMEANQLFIKWKELLNGYKQEKAGWQLSHPKAKALENFLRGGKLFTEVLFPAMAAYGVCDLFLSIVQLLSPGAPSSQYNFARVAEADAPLINAENISHVNFQGVVPINFDFKVTPKVGGVSVTGGNGSGKSFAFRQLLSNIVFAQAYGIVRGNLEFSPFAKIDVHANVSDSDTASKYMNEVTLFEGAVNFIKRMPKDKKALIYFDESFASTESETAAQILETNAEFLKQHPGVMTIFVTHFKPLAYASMLEPWRTRVAKNIDGTYKNLFTLERGVSEENNALLAMYKACGNVWQKMHAERFGNKESDKVKQPSVNDKAEAAPAA